MFSSLFTRISAAVVLLTSSIAVAQINPGPPASGGQINWPVITGSGAPSGGACTSANYGQPYTETTGPHQFVCTPSGWYQTDGGGGSSSYTNVIASASGDTTVAAINAKCTGGQTYFASIPLSIATGGTIASGCNVMLAKGGLWTIASGQTVTFANMPSETDGPSKHFAGSGTVAFPSGFPWVEWFGAVNDNSTDSTAGIQACVNAITSGQCRLQAGTYVTSSVITVSISSVGLIGVPGGGPGSGTSAVSSIIKSTSASADIIDVGSGSTLAYNAFQNFAVTRSTGPTGTATGLSFINVGGLILDNTQSLNSVRDYYLSGVPAYGSGHISNNQATTVSGGYGFYIDSVSYASPSMRMNANSTSTTGGGAGYGFYFHGSPQDLMMDRSETGGETYGIYMDCSPPGGKLDVHLRNSILDANATAGIYLNSCGSVEIEGGWISDSGTTAIDVESGTNITIQKGLQIDGSYSTAAIYLNGTTNSAVQGVNFLGSCGTCIKLNSSNANTITDNDIGSNGYGIYLAGSSNNALSGNVINATGSFAGILLDSSSNNNPYANLNSFSSSTSTPISDAGTGNQLSGISSLTTIGTSGPATFSGGVLNIPQYTSAGGGGNYTNLCATVTLSSGATCSGSVIAVTTGTATVTISAIPTTYVKLVLDWGGPSTATAGDIDMQLNGDAAAHYTYQEIQASNGTQNNSPASGYASGSGPIGLISTGGSGGEVIFPFPDQSIQKAWVSNGYLFDGSNVVTSIRNGLWTQTGAITSITLTPQHGNFGTMFFALYGAN